MTLSMLVLPLALSLDWLLGEPKKYHPLVAFGALAQIVEQRLRGSRRLNLDERWLGLLAWATLVLPLPIVLWLLLSHLPLWLSLVLQVSVLYLCIGGKSLAEHALRVDRALKANNLVLARDSVAMMVSRDTEALSSSGVRRATIESVLENGSDAVVAPLFWFVIAGAPGAMMYRLINTLDAMWGYRNKKYIDFGWAAARLDDLANYIPARICALGYLVAGDFKSGWQCWRKQGGMTDSPNAGVVMAAGAGALALQLGGDACYGGQWHTRPLLGAGAGPKYTDIHRSVALVTRAVLACTAVFVLLEISP